jgi:hypothetical protein
MAYDIKSKFANSPLPCWQGYERVPGTKPGSKGSCRKAPAMKDPKVGTGKKPKGSGRRLYTDENPKDTIGIKFATPADARASVKKVLNSNKSYARKMQILTVGEQRSRYSKTPKREQQRIFKQGKDKLRKQYGKEKT